ncbi:hypothetical protein [Streptomyces longhuiensis]|uniref:hypothetical protein n=1 Tax=Streptomyces longhuiensis TaxID=2880933 RepID=UPI001D09E3CA|nr:hypothetical protein [Streptomyces longhuiensis]UDM00048.1 hypothetical protein LGI35_18065 [Streptomyces longhuiensis]
MIHDLITTAQLVLYASLAWSAVAGILVASVIVALAGAVTGLWARIGTGRRAEQPAAEYEEAA